MISISLRFSGFHVLNVIFEDDAVPYSQDINVTFTRLSLLTGWLLGCVLLLTLSCALPSVCPLHFHPLIALTSCFEIAHLLAYSSTGLSGLGKSKLCFLLCIHSAKSASHFVGSQ